MHPGFYATPPNPPTIKSRALGVAAHAIKASGIAQSKTHLEFRLAAASAITNPELLLEYQRQAFQRATQTSEPGQSAATDPNPAREPNGTENAQPDATDTAVE
jgi:hypothetical protein